MLARRKPLLAVALALSVVLVPTAAGANTVAISEWEVEGNTATVQGTVSFPPITTPQNVGGTKTNFPVAAVADALGINVTGGRIIPINGGLRFVWDVTSLPDPIPPEGIRYTWAFQIGTNEYQLQAKRLNLASVTTLEDPVGHAQHFASGQDFFQLRGACTTSYLGTPASGCYHLAFLNGVFDIPNSQVRVDLPYRTRDSIGRLVAEDFEPGAVLTALNSAGMSIAGCPQVVVSQAMACAYINSWSPYFAGPRLQVAVGSHTTSPANANYGTVVSTESGDFTATVSGLSTTNNTVFFRACNGTTATCAFASQRVIF